MAAGVWFRKCLRLHDNAALVEAVSRGGPVVPFFILDPFFDRAKVGVNRYNFLLESLRDLDEQLRTSHGSRLLVFQGKPEEVLRDLFRGKGAVTLKSLYWEHDTEPYARARDARVVELAKECDVITASFSGHTLLDVDSIVAKKGFKAPTSMKMIENIFTAAGPLKDALPVPKIPPLDNISGFDVPLISDFYSDAPTAAGTFPGGEREALRRLGEVCEDVDYICMFEKPKTASTGKLRNPMAASTTGLSPYLKFGCLSVRTAWHAFARAMAGRRHTQPPQSLHGQLLFREMFYILGAAVPNFDKPTGNPMCKDIPWGKDAELAAAWEEGRTGYPFIDALMRQLKQTGWMHHLGRHAVACFLTRGDLWQNWTVGRDVFDKLLLDADWAVNNGNWLWLAGVAPFSAPYYRIYDPCPGPKSSLNAEQTGEFVRAFVPELRKIPAKYIYKPWTAPLDIQKKADCIIGEHYPFPIVDHAKSRERNLEMFKAGLEGLKAGGAVGSGGAKTGSGDEGGASPLLPAKFRFGDTGPMVNAKMSGPDGSTSKGKAAGKGGLAAAFAKGGKRGGSGSARPASPVHKQRRWNRNATSPPIGSIPVSDSPAAGG
mmetsp:Transcript_45138/g.107363  ORF Transcript_45138/g.107363 Transcript_45138/m.107363 type:complete len:601 (-) Transcript_45138:236-2038(-)